MDMQTLEKNNYQIAIIRSDEVLIKGVQSALDFIATVRYETGCERIILNESAISEEFLH